MLEALQAHMPQGVTWTRPAGGMFAWLTLPQHVDATALLDRAIERKVAYVPGEPFFASAPQKNTLRLSFVTVSPERIRSGVQTLAEIIGAAIANDTKAG